MHFPNEKMIFEIPIYSMTEKEFKRRWDKWRMICVNVRIRQIIPKKKPKKL